MQFTSFVLLLVLGQCLAENPWTPAARDASWLKRHEALVNQTLQHHADEQVIFIGDSITEGWAGNGQAVWTQYYAPKHAYNYGIGGDQTQHVLYRIANKEFDGLTAAKVSILMIGTNNLGGNTVEDIAHGIKEILAQLEAKMPSTKIILLGVLPRDEPLGAKAKQLNALIAKYADDSKVFWCDMWSAFESADGKQMTELYVSDHLHLDAAGYAAWQKTMEPLLTKLDV